MALQHSSGSCDASARLPGADDASTLQLAPLAVKVGGIELQALSENPISLAPAMLTKTSRSAIRVLIHLAGSAGDQPLSPRYLAQQLGESPTYLAKVVRQLVKAGILRARRGVAGGVLLQQNPEEISLLAIVEACQGKILPDFCQPVEDLSQTCGLHRAGAELHAAILGVLSRWTLADLLQQPPPAGRRARRLPCWMAPASGTLDTAGDIG